MGLSQSCEDAYKIAEENGWLKENKDNDNWISMSEKYPRLGQKVILFSNNVVQEDIFMYDESDDSCFWHRDDIDECPIVQESDYWQPLPSKPIR